MTTMTPPTAPPPPPPPGTTGPGDVPPPPPPPAGPRRLQRSADDRIAGGVAGGLGEYFGFDPVLFRVLFAVAAFFGGTGVLVYAVLWLVLPRAGDPTTSPADRVGAWLREHRVPLWLAGGVALVLTWAVFGALVGPQYHGPFFPGAAVVGLVLLVIALRRGDRHPSRPDGAPGTAPGTAPTAGATATPPAAGAPTVSLTKPVADPADRPLPSWFREAREAGRRRRRRARPVVLATLCALVVGLGVVGTVDALSGVALPVYGLVGGGTVLLGAITAAVVRRPAYSLLWLLVPALVWVAAFAGTHVSLRDGAGDRVVRPASAAALDPDYRQAFGRLTVDLRDVYAAASTGGPSTVRVQVAAGVARVVVPTDADVTVHTHVRAGSTLVDGTEPASARGGWRMTGVVPARGTHGPALDVELVVTDGVAVVDHAG